MDVFDNQRSLPPYESPPPWIPPRQRIGNPDYDNDLRIFLPRKTCLRRQKITDTLGFNIRGGKEGIPGMFITGVNQGSEAERLGVRVGDQIIEVNGVNFENIDHTQAVTVLKSSLEVKITLRFFPYMYNRAMEKGQD